MFVMRVATPQIRHERKRFVCIHMRVMKMAIHMCDMKMTILYGLAFKYGVAMICRLLQNIGPFYNIYFFHRVLLQKRPMFLGSLLIVATSYPHSRMRTLIRAAAIPLALACCSVCCSSVLQSVLQALVCCRVCCSLLPLACHYGVATTSRLLRIIGLFCKRAL